jgi:hypothetical protein
MTALMWFVGLPCFLWLCVELYRAIRGPKRNRRNRLGNPVRDSRSSIEYSRPHMPSSKRFS